LLPFFEFAVEISQHVRTTPLAPTGVLCLSTTGTIISSSIQEKPEKRERQYYHNRQAQELAFFPTESIPFGTAIGWPDITDNSNKRRSHSWDLAEENS